MNNKRKIDCRCTEKYPEKRWIQFLILRVVYEKPSYGYKIVELIEDLTGGRHQLKLGTVYTLLRRMEKNGLVISEWKKNEKTPDKRIYRVTQKGEKLLKNWLEAIIERKKMMNKMVKFYQKHFKEKSNEKK
jgi:PadR family transcriptional regulator, regulatory protein PadR